MEATTLAPIAPASTCACRLQHLIKNFTFDVYGDDDESDQNDDAGWDDGDLTICSIVGQN